MTMITLTGGRSFKLLLLHAFLLIMLSAHLSPALGFISGVGVGDANNIRCIEGERQALLEFKKGLVDDYGRLSSWQSGDENKNCCNWEGVRCSNLTGHVLELHLSAPQNDEGEITKPFGGMISSSLLELPYLTYLDLSSNNFNQSYMPKFIGSLSNLKILALADANLSGPIPHHLQNLSHLQQLYLGENHWKNIENLEWLSHLSSIEDLDLSDTNLSIANDWFEVVSILPNLKTLVMQFCDLPSMSLSSFPRFNDSKSFASLEGLYLNYNQLVHIPKSLGNICTLRELILFSNHLNGQLVELINNLSGCAKDSLEILNLSDNQITGSLPNFAIFPSLKEIYLSGNKLNGTLPKSIGNLYKLEDLRVDWNFLQGVISESIFSNLSKLRRLDLSNNSLSLEFSFDWVPPFQLNKIYFTSCNLGPRFPNWIRTQRNVSFLEISDTKISDTIPAEWLADLPPTLNLLNLSNNHIYGRLPNVSTKGLNVLAIDLSANSLEGPLPHFPTNLTILNLSKNQFSGSISSLCEINGQLLAYLDLSHNRLSGRLPNCFMQWPKLLILNLGGNHFFGEVPSSLGSLSVLNTLSLNNNNFSGNLPSSLRNCSSLIAMDMRNNRFSGNVPAWIGERLPSLIFLSLHSNMFNGSIPLHLCWLKDLQILDLSLNEISGTIPQCLNNFTAMAQKRHYIFRNLIPLSDDNDGTIYTVREYFGSVRVEVKRNEYEYHGTNLGLLKIIDLSSNKLIGKLPSEIFSLLDLFALNVSRNNLIGEIPPMIGQLKELESLDLSRNQFSGEIPSSMSELNFLSILDLSYNNLSGKIPSGTQLQGFDASCFIGNRALCGPPLTQKCPGEETPNRSEVTTKDNEDELGKWFFVGTGCGFAIGFWGVCSSLLLKRSWRHAYFLLLDNMKDWIYVTITVNIARLQRKIQRQG